MSLTHKQKECLEYIKSYVHRHGGVSPSFDEIRRHLRLGSKSGVYRIITGLEERGYIERHKQKWRSLTLTSRAFGAKWTEGSVRKDERRTILRDLKALASSYNQYNGKTAILMAIADYQSGVRSEVEA